MSATSGNAPMIACQRCENEWTLAYELDELHAGNSALEQFALDHERHTGHYPDDVQPWIVSCRQCPAREQFLRDDPATRWARTHARHTRHSVEVSGPGSGARRIDPGSV